MTHHHFIRPLDHAQGNVDKPNKVTFLQNDRMLVGLNSLLPGQRQALHDHPAQEKFYYVLDGLGDFTVGDETRTCGPQELILCPAGAIHGVVNNGDTLLTFLTVIAPFTHA